MRAYLKLFVIIAIFVGIDSLFFAPFRALKEMETNALKGWSPEALAIREKLLFSHHPASKSGLQYEDESEDDGQQGAEHEEAVFYRRDCRQIRANRH